MDEQSYISHYRDVVTFLFVLNCVSMGKKIKITKEFKDAFTVMNGDDPCIFLTGKAGTGKSTLLRYFRKKTKKKHVVLAPTGVAALNVKGQTIHSFFGFHPQININMVKKAHPDRLAVFQNLETIVIDEISMVRADLLDCVDRALRLNRDSRDPFGGVQMIFIGDLFQLPPVVTREEEEYFKSRYASPYFFSADVMKELIVKKIELQQVHRQEEKAFVELLNAVRRGKVTEEVGDELGELHDPFFQPEEEAGEMVHLTTTNKMAKERNDFELRQIEKKEWKLNSLTEGSFGSRKMPSEHEMRIKEGARVMFTVNDTAKRWVNGSTGYVTRIKKNGLAKFPLIEVELDSGEVVDVGHYRWEMVEYTYTGEGFEPEIVGACSQYPLALAWAVTIHKAQGKTFEKVLIDMGWGAFAHGQMYVALSRVTTREGVTLLRPFRKEDVIVDEAVLNFMQQ